MFFFGRLRLGLSPDKFYLPCHMNDRGGKKWQRGEGQGQVLEQGKGIEAYWQVS